MPRLTLFLICCATIYAPFATADEASALAALRAGCTDDAQKLCAGVPSGGGRILACLKAHKDELSAQCKQAAAVAAPAAPASGAMISSPAAAPVSPSAAAKPASAAAPPSPAPGRTAHAVKDAPGAFLRMKRVQIIDQGMDKVQAPLPAFDLMIPSAWNFKGNVAFGGGQGGCFADMFAVSWDATNADGSVAFQGAPTYSWQYADDPAVLKKLTDPKRRALGAGGKPCPVLNPMKAD